MVPNRSSAWVLRMVVVFLAAGSACAGSPAKPDSMNGGGTPWEGIPGWENTFKPPRTDTPPGSVIALWKKQEPTIICENKLGGVPAALNDNNPPISMSGDRTAKINAGLTTKIVDIVSATLGVSGNSSVSVTNGNLTPVTLYDPTGYIDTVKNDLGCKKRIATACSSEEASHFYLLTAVLKQSYSYTVSAGTDGGASINVDALKKISGSTATVSFDGNDSSKINVSAAGVYTNFQVLDMHDVICPKKN
jgi:hypothetical protein